MFGHVAARQFTASRRQILKAGALTGAGFVLGVRLPLPYAQAQATGTLAPNAFVRVGSDDTVTVIIKHVEMGQGIYTGLSTLVAEEMDADWSRVRAETAPADAKVYNNLNWGPMQGTGGSTSIANSYMQMREAGAAARAMLVAAAAAEWGVPVGEIDIAKGVVSHHASGRNARFGALAAKAAQQAVPAKPKLKEPDKFTLIGTTVPRLDSPSKTDGSAIFAMDFYLPGTLTALMTRPPRFGAKVKSIDAGAAKAIPGVLDVVQVPRGVAVLAKDFWSARKGRDALRVTWDETGAEKRGSHELIAAYRKLATTPGKSARNDGDARTRIAGAARTIEAEYVFPYLAHAPMEPLNCVVRLQDGRCDVWAGSQFQTIDHATAAKEAGLPPDKVAIHTLLAGGSFGRRANAEADYIAEGVSIAKAIGGKAPVKLVWTREDDVRGGRYRPIYVHRLAAGLDADGNIAGWQHRIVGQSILAGTPMASMIENGIDRTSVEGASTLPYAIADLAVELHTTEVGVPPLWWRSVGSTHTAFSTETFLDEIAATAGKDPVELRRALLRDHPRHLATLNLAADKAGWTSPIPAGRGRGIAVHESFDTVVAQVAEVSRRKRRPSRGTGGLRRRLRRRGQP